MLCDQRHAARRSCNASKRTHTQPHAATHTPPPRHTHTHSATHASAQPRSHLLLGLAPRTAAGALGAAEAAARQQAEQQRGRARARQDEKEAVCLQSWCVRSVCVQGACGVCQARCVCLAFTRALTLPLVMPPASAAAQRSAAHTRTRNHTHTQAPASNHSLALPDLVQLQNWFQHWLAPVPASGLR
jgi:hypothetical protein